MADSKENYLRDLGNERDKRTWLHLFNPQPYLHTWHRRLVTNEGSLWNIKTKAKYHHRIK